MPNAWRKCPGQTVGGEKRNPRTCRAGNFKQKHPFCGCCKLKRNESCRAAETIAYFRAFSPALFNLVAIANLHRQTAAATNKVCRPARKILGFSSPSWWPFKAIWGDFCQWQVLHHRQRHHHQNSKRPKTLCGFSSCSFFFFTAAFPPQLCGPAPSTFHQFSVLSFQFSAVSVHDLCCLALALQNLGSASAKSGKTWRKTPLVSQCSL